LFSRFFYITQCFPHSLFYEVSQSAAGASSMICFAPKISPTQTFDKHIDDIKKFIEKIDRIDPIFLQQIPNMDPFAYKINFYSARLNYFRYQFSIETNLTKKDELQKKIEYFSSSLDSIKQVKIDNERIKGYSNDRHENLLKSFSYDNLFSFSIIPGTNVLVKQSILSNNIAQIEITENSTQQKNIIKKLSYDIFETKKNLFLQTNLEYLKYHIQNSFNSVPSKIDLLKQTHTLVIQSSCREIYQAKKMLEEAQKCQKIISKFFKTKSSKIKEISEIIGSDSSGKTQNDSEQYQELKEKVLKIQQDAYLKIAKAQEKLTAHAEVVNSLFLTDENEEVRDLANAQIYADQVVFAETSKQLLPFKKQMQTDNETYTRLITSQQQISQIKTSIPSGDIAKQISSSVEKRIKSVEIESNQTIISEKIDNEYCESLGISVFNIGTEEGSCSQNSITDRFVSAIYSQI
jgi:hypothetical protein